MFLMTHQLWTVFSHVRSSLFRILHGWFCADLIVVYINSQGMRQPDKVDLPTLAFQTFVPSNSILCWFMTCLWFTFFFSFSFFDSIIFGTFILHLNLCWKWGGIWARESRTILWVSKCMDVWMLDNFLIVMRCHVQVITTDMFIT